MILNQILTKEIRKRVIFFLDENKTKKSTINLCFFCCQFSSTLSLIARRSSQTKMLVILPVEGHGSWHFSNVFFDATFGKQSKSRSKTGELIRTSSRACTAHIWSWNLAKLDINSFLLFWLGKVHLKLLVLSVLKFYNYSEYSGLLTPRNAHPLRRGLTQIK